MTTAATIFANLYYLANKLLLPLTGDIEGIREKQNIRNGKERKIHGNKIQKIKWMKIRI